MGGFYVEQLLKNQLRGTHKKEVCQMETSLPAARIEPFTPFLRGRVGYFLGLISPKGRQQRIFFLSLSPLTELIASSHCWWKFNYQPCCFYYKLLFLGVLLFLFLRPFYAWFDHGSSRNRLMEKQI